MSLDLDFRPPPPGGRLDHAAVVETLREHPNAWAVLPRAFPTAAAARSQAYQINRGGGRYGPKGAFEAVSRSESDANLVWVRHITREGEGHEHTEKPDPA